MDLQGKVIKLKIVLNEMSVDNALKNSGFSFNNN